MVIVSIFAKWYVQKNLDNQLPFTKTPGLPHDESPGLFLFAQESTYVRAAKYPTRLPTDQWEIWLWLWGAFYHP